MVQRPKLWFLAILTCADAHAKGPKDDHGQNKGAHRDDVLGRVQVKEDGCLDDSSIEFLFKYTGGFVGAKG